MLGQRRTQRLDTTEECHRNRSPDQRNQALRDHRTEEYGAALLLVGQAARHQRRLRSVETRNRTARNRNEERRHDGEVGRVGFEVVQRGQFGNRVVAKE